MNGDNGNPSGRDLTWLDVAAIWYLVVPVAIWCATWLQPAYGIPAALALVLGIIIKSDVRLPPARLLLAATLGVFALAISGTSPLIGSIQIDDLGKIRWIFHDLSTQSWPVRYVDNEVLRYSLGAYIVPSLLSKVWTNTIWWLYGWLAIGVALFLAFAAERAQSATAAIMLSLVGLTFGGLDLIGVPWYILPTYGFGFNPTAFREHWLNSPYSWFMFSNIAELSWAPTHAITGWLGGALLYRNWSKPWFISRSFVVFVALTFWSPLCGLAFAVIMTALSITQIRLAFAAGVSWQNAFAVPAIALVGIYFASGDTAPHRWVYDMPLFDFIRIYGLLITVEFGLIATAAIWIRRPNHPTLVTLMVLCAIPFYHIGSATNDFSFSGSRVPLMILLLFVIDALCTPTRWIKKAILAGLLGICAYDSIGAAIANARNPRVLVNANLSIKALPEFYHHQYIATAPSSSALTAILRPRHY